MSWLQVVLFAYGLINIAGGAFAYQRTGSMPSLVVGAGSGLALVILAAWTYKAPAVGFRLAGVVAAGLGAFWVYRLLTVIAEGGSPMMPAMNLALAAFVFVSLIVSHFFARRKRRLESTSASN